MFLSITRRPPTPTLFPYTTLFRSFPQPENFLELRGPLRLRRLGRRRALARGDVEAGGEAAQAGLGTAAAVANGLLAGFARERDRKSTRLNSSHGYISYAVFCLKKK